MSRLLPSLRYVAFCRVGLLSRAHDLIDYVTGPRVVRLTQPLESPDAPGVVAGWAVWSQIEDRFAPILAAPFEALVPGGDSLIEPTAALYHVRFASPAQQVPLAGYAVTEIRQGAWVPVVDRDQWLATLGLQIMPDLDDVDAAMARADVVEAARSAEPTSGLTIWQMRELMQNRYSALLDATGATPQALRELHGVAQAMAEHLGGAVE
jgi:hypothetical protein